MVRSASDRLHKKSIFCTKSTPLVGLYVQSRLEQWAPGVTIEFNPDGGLELLVLEGGFSEGSGAYLSQSWLRLPIGEGFSARVGREGCRVWVKEGHLRSAHPE
jgi:hypothetical protein